MDLEALYALDRTSSCLITVCMKTTKSNPDDLDTRPPLPLVFARSALFSASTGTRRLNGYALPCAKARDSSLSYCGPQLSQWHSFLWQAVVQRATDIEVVDSTPFAVPAAALGRAVGLESADTRMRRRIGAALDDLIHANVHAKTTCQEFRGPLLLALGRKVGTNHLGIRLDPGLMYFLKNEVVHNNLRRKCLVRRHGLAAWLHDYLSTHLEIPAERMETLRMLSGSTLSLPAFRRGMKEALELLKGGASPLVRSWSIDHRDRLLVEKSKTRVVILPKAATAITADRARHCSLML